MNKIKKLPDFIIGGAMKSGTTSLHHILAAHEKVYIPNPEIFFFCLDEFCQHPRHFIPSVKKMQVPDYRFDFEKKLKWYASFFEGAQDDQIIGEDTTTYLSSTKAPCRIAELLPNVKMIFVLRDPVKRAHSHYWHMVRVGLAQHSLERTFRLCPSTILQRGHYKEQLERFYSVMGKDRIKVLFFEDFVIRTQSVIDEICEFIGLEKSVDVQTVDTYKNRTAPPRFPGLQLFFNRIDSEQRINTFLTKRRNFKDKIESQSKLMHKLGHCDVPPEGFRNGLKNVVKQVFFDEKAKNPAMKKGTESFLQAYYRMENKGLDELLEIDLSVLWPWVNG